MKVQLQLVALARAMVLQDEWEWASPGGNPAPVAPPLGIHFSGAVPVLKENSDAC
jgi:hypothetical protein